MMSRLCRVSSWMVVAAAAVSGASCCSGGDRTAAPADIATAPAPMPWYEPEIRAFEAADKAAPPAAGQVLFVGSSSIRLWSTLAQDMRPAPVINRGFGGSKTDEVLAVFDRTVRPYRPRVIVYYCGDNDLGADNTDSEGVSDRFAEFARKAREIWPRVRVMYIAIKPSIARWHNWPAMERANALVRAHCEASPGMMYLDTASWMLGADGKPDPTLFKPDGLHMNAKGYALWTGVVRPAVLGAWSGHP